jgi:hypothetical protein
VSGGPPRRAAASLLLTALLGADPSIARASGDVAFSWSRETGAEECADEDELRASVERRLERAVFDDAAPLHIDGRIARLGRRFRVEIALRASGAVIGRRVLESDRARCRALDDSLAVMIALLVEVGEESVELALPVASDDPAAPPSEEPADVARHPIEPRGAAPASLERAEGSARWLGFAMSLGVIGALDALPGVAFAPLAALELVHAPVSIRLEGAYAPETDHELGSARRARLSLAWAGILGCLGERVLAWLALGGCAGLRGGALIGAGAGFDTSASGLLPWLAASASGRARAVVAGPFGVELAIGLDVPLLRDRFVAGAPDGSIRHVHGPPPVAPFLALSLVLFAGESPPW